MTHHTFFISDLHLESTASQTSALFEQFMQTQAPRAEALYILGDFFEYWIGDDDRSSFNQWVKEQLRGLATEIPVYIMEGNRDFLLGEQFVREAGCQRLPDPTVVELYGRRLLLTHGDRFCTQDSLHQWFRRITGWRWVKRLFQWCPLSWRRAIAARFRQMSKRHHKHLTAESMDVTPEAVRHAFKRHNVSLMIHGHTHQPATHSHDLEQRQVDRVVLGAWEDGAEVMKLDDNGHFKLIALNR